MPRFSDFKFPWISIPQPELPFPYRFRGSVSWHVTHSTGPFSFAFARNSSLFHRATHFVINSTMNSWSFSSTSVCPGIRCFGIFAKLKLSPWQSVHQTRPLVGSFSGDSHFGFGLLFFGTL